MNRCTLLDIKRAKNKYKCIFDNQIVEICREYEETVGVIYLLGILTLKAQITTAADDILKHMLLLFILNENKS